VVPREYLEVAVDDAQRMEMLQRERDLGGVESHLTRRGGVKKNRVSQKPEHSLPTDSLRYLVFVESPFLLEVEKQLTAVDIVCRRAVLRRSAGFLTREAWATRERERGYQGRSRFSFLSGRQT
jgi:hypothetical protein